LKPAHMGGPGDWPPSPPTRGRGLKRGTLPLWAGWMRVAPHAGAWIETASVSESLEDR
jgi:hypothetical protein